MGGVGTTSRSLQDLLRRERENLSDARESRGAFIRKQPSLASDLATRAYLKEEAEPAGTTRKHQGLGAGLRLFFERGSPAKGTTRQGGEVPIRNGEKLRHV